MKAHTIYYETVALPDEYTYIDYSVERYEAHSGQTVCVLSGSIRKAGAMRGISRHAEILGTFSSVDDADLIRKAIARIDEMSAGLEEQS